MNHYHKQRYGVIGRGMPANKTKCCETVTDGAWHERQCSRKKEYGPNNNYCKQHAKQFDN